MLLMSRPRSVCVVYMRCIFIFSLILIVINHITSLEQMHLFFVYFLEYLPLLLDDNLDEERE